MRIHRLFLCEEVILLQRIPGYDTKQPDVEVSSNVEFWGIMSTPSLPSLPGPL